MTFQPIVPFGGFAGWSFLNRTRETQQEAFDQSVEIVRDTDYFAANIGEITTAEDLVKDRRLLSVALGAFGLDDDIGNKFFINKILADGTLEPDALANRMSDKRYLAMSKAFGFGDFPTPNTQLSDFPAKIIDAFKTQKFEAAIGAQNEDMRLVKSLDRDLTEIVEKSTSDDGRWFTIMGTPPLRKIFETALGLPASFGAIDINQQLTTFREQSERLFGEGEVSQFSDPEKRDELVRVFLARSDIISNSASFSPSSAALTLLQST